MKESQLLGTLLLSIPEFQPIIREIREKYNLPEISPNDDPITEIYLGDEMIPLKDFRHELETLVQDNPIFLPPQIANLYAQGRAFLSQPVKMQKYDQIPAEMQKAILDQFNMIRKMAEYFVKIMDEQCSRIADMLYAYLLTGESEEIPNDWISKVVTLPNGDEKIVLALATQITNPEVIVQQFREEYAKAFGKYRPKITKIVVNTAYYMRLQRMGKKWNFIVEEFIRLNKFSLPRDRSSERYFKIWHKYEQLLRKRIQRSEKVLEILVMDKK